MLIIWGKKLLSERLKLKQNLTIPAGFYSFLLIGKVGHEAKEDQEPPI